MLTIDHSRIPLDVLNIALNNAARDPDGQVFPWRPMCPLAGSTVYHDGQLWTVADKDYGGAPPCALLIGCGHGGEAIVALADLRPVTWTAANERELADPLAGFAPDQIVIGPAGETLADAAAEVDEDDEPPVARSYEDTHSYTRNAHTCVGGESE
jgi:hypothetical protein